MKNFLHIIESLIVKILFALFYKLKIEKSSNLCAFIARFIGPKLKVNYIARKNLNLAKFNEEDHNKIITSMWDNLGRVFGEFPFIYKLSDDDFKSRIIFEGLENIQFVKQGKQALFFSGHLANWEVGARAIAYQNIKFALIYRKSNNLLIDKMILNERARNNIKAIRKGIVGSKEIILALKSNYNIAMLVDQKLNEGIEVPFYGINAMTAPAIAKISLKYNLPIIPLEVIRKKGANWIIKFHPAINLDKDDNNYIYNTMCQINLILEEWISNNPSSWFWLHRRWPKIKY